MLKSGQLLDGPDRSAHKTQGAKPSRAGPPGDSGTARCAEWVLSCRLLRRFCLKFLPMRTRVKMAREKQRLDLEIRQFRVYYLRVVPLATGDAEYIEIGNDLEDVIDRIVGEKSLQSILVSKKLPIRYCQIEEEEAIHVNHLNKTYYEGIRKPVWKFIIPAASIYGRETIESCILRNSGRNIDKYTNALDNYPKATRFFTFSSTEIRPVDDSVFVMDDNTRVRE